MNNKEPQEFLISLNDGFKILKKKRKLILFAAAIFSVTLGIYALTKPIQYLGEATFREKGNGQGINNLPSLALFFNGIQEKEKSSARSILRSRTFLEKLIIPLNLQASLKKSSSNFGTIKSIGDNLRVEYSYLRKRHDYPLSDPIFPLQVEKVYFNEEIPLTLKLVFSDEKSFSVFNSKKEILGTGVVGEPFSTSLFSFILVQNGNASLAKEVFFLTLSPIADVAKALSQQIAIESNKDDPTLLKLSYKDRDRRHASFLLNQLMLYYQEHLKEEQQRLALAQISYLHNREEEMEGNLKKIANTFADALSEDIADVGHPNTEKAMEFLASQLHQYKKRVLQINLELNMHQKTKELALLSQSKLSPHCFPEKLNTIVYEIQKYQQRRDNIELALRTSLNPSQQEKWDNHFAMQMEKLNEIRCCRDEAKVLLTSLQDPSLPFPTLQKLDDPKYGIRTWQAQLINYKDSSTDNYFSNFSSYVTNLIRFLEMSEKTIQERLSHQMSSNEFEGINLEVAQQLYIQHSTLLNNLETQIIQLQFLTERILNPDFELSSLGVIIKDPFTTKLIEMASAHLLAIQDDVNRGIKEKERLKQELFVHKKFLGVHIDQTIQLLSLQKELTQDKIYSLQQETLGLIQKQLSILENQLAEGIVFHVRNLEHERELIRLHEKEIREEMVKLPKKWISEKLFEHRVGVNKTMVEELAKLVETKNIASNLDAVQSAPLDHALPPIKPIRPPILLYAALGGILGAFLTGAAFLTHAIISGLTISRHNLELAGMHVSGLMGSDPNQNSATIRRLLNYFDQGKTFEKKGKAVVCVKERKSSYPIEIATFLSKKGAKVALCTLLSSNENSSKDRPFDILNLNDVSIEWVDSKPFNEWLVLYKEKYDWIVVEGLTKPSSPEAESLFTVFDHVAYFVSHETIQELQGVIDQVRGLDRVASFVIEE